jgi:hypothetical protein
MAFNAKMGNATIDTHVACPIQKTKKLRGYKSKPAGIGKPVSSTV